MVVKRYLSKAICKLSAFIIVFISVLSFINPGTVKADQSYISVLFIGNSITYSSEFNPYGLDMFKNLVLGSGRGVYVDYVAYNSEKLNTYANPNAWRGQVVRNKINSRNWDYIVMQQYTDFAMADPDGTIGAVSTLADYIRSNCPSAKILLNSTFAYGVASRNDYDGRVWSRNEQRLGLMITYEMAARAVGGTVIYSGEVNERVWGQVAYPYLSDANHPNSYGAFGNACAVYKTIFNESPAKSSYNGGLSANVALTIKNIAAGVDHSSVSGLAPFAEEDGRWHYYYNGQKGSNISTVAQNRYGWWRVKDGIVDFSCNTIEQNSYGWWKITNGKVDFSYNGIGHNSNGSWFVRNGRVTFEDSGVLYSKSDNGWYYAERSYISTSLNSVKHNSNGWWVIRNGKVDFGFYGMAENENGWWRIENGKVNFNYKGFSSNQYGWWYLENGTVRFNKNDVIYGVVDGNTGWWHVVKNKVTFDTTVAHNSNGWWYIKDGRVDFGYTGIGTNSYGTWRIENGKVNFGYNGTAVIDGIEYKFSSGKVVSSTIIEEEPADPEPVIPDPAEPDPTEPDPTEPDPAEQESETPEVADPEPVVPSSADPEPAAPESVLPDEP